MTAPAKTYRWTPPGTLGLALQVLLIVAGVGTAIVDLALVPILSRDVLVVHLPAPGDAPPFVWTTSWWPRLLWIPSLVSQATIVVWLVWQHHAAANLRARGYERLRVTPGWAVGWWFVPIANLWMPLVSMLELDRRSTPDGQERRASPLLGWWWGAWLAQSLLPAAAIVIAVAPRFESWARMVEPNATTIDVTPLANVAAPWLAVAGLLQLVAAVLAMRVVGRIDAAQLQLADLTAVPPRPDLAAAPGPDPRR